MQSLILMLVISQVPTTELKLEDGVYSPFFAITTKERIFVADHYKILIFDHAGDLVRTVGQKGQGPEDFNNAPERLEIVEDKLLAYTMQGWSVHEYAMNGDFLMKRRTTPREFETQGQLFIKHMAQEEGRQFVYSHKNCRLGSYFFKTFKDEHLMRSILRVGKAGEVFLVKRSGEIQVFNNCELTQAVSLPLHAYKKPLEEDPIIAGFARLSGDKHVKGYLYGLPILDVAVENSNFLWLLIENEHAQSKLGAPQSVNLVRCNLNTATLDHRLPFEEPIRSLSIHNDFLTLSSSQEGWVRIYKLNTLTE